MGVLSSKLTSITFGTVGTASTIPILRRGNSSSTGVFTTSDSGSSMGFVNCSLYAEDGVWNALWNDFADYQQLAGELIPGKCYIDTYEGATVCTDRCQLSVIGIASDTYGMTVGNGRFEREVPIAVSGWVLAYVDKQYPCGTPLTNDQYGNLTEMTLEEKRDYPERLVALYKKHEENETFGNERRNIKVDGRHWVKVKS
jgi:hypothetical protein